MTGLQNCFLISNTKRATWYWLLNPLAQICWRKTKLSSILDVLKNLILFSVLEKSNVIPLVLWGTWSAVNWLVMITYLTRGHDIFPCWILTHWDRMTHICVSEIIIIGSDNGLSPGRHKAIIWTNAWILLSEPLGTNFSEILIEIHTFSFNKMHLNMSSEKVSHFVSASMC